LLEFPKIQNPIVLMIQKTFPGSGTIMLNPSCRAIDGGGVTRREYGNDDYPEGPFPAFLLLSSSSGKQGNE